MTKLMSYEAVCPRCKGNARLYRPAYEKYVACFYCDGRGTVLTGWPTGDEQGKEKADGN